MRIIYNTSFIIHENIEQEWVAFMRDIIFTKVSIDQPEGKTYSLQLVFNTEEEQEHFLFNWLPTIEEKIIQNYTNQYVCFSSVLKEI